MICDIAIPVWNKKELTERCLNSILSNTAFPYRIVLIDNASREFTKKYLESVAAQNPERIKLIVNKENLGNSTAGRQGMEYSDAAYVCILDNDTIVCKNWLTEMVKIAEMLNNIGIINPSSNTFGLRKKKDESLKDFASCLQKENSGKYVEIGTAVGFCYLVKRNVINEIGYWDERFTPGYFEDTEYSMRAKKKGYKSVTASGAYVYHEEHASFKSKEKKKEFEKLFNESRNKFHALCGKPKRILYIATKKNKEYLSSLKERTYIDADKANWATVFIKNDLGNVELIKHGNIRKITIEKDFFNWKVLWRVVTKKKKFDAIYVDDEKLLKSILLFSKIHKAEAKLLKI